VKSIESVVHPEGCCASVKSPLYAGNHYDAHESFGPGSSYRMYMDYVYRFMYNCTCMYTSAANLPLNLIIMFIVEICFIILTTFVLPKTF
jgi:hypothetical protein